MNRALLFLTHVASQLMYRWLDPFFDESLKNSEFLKSSSYKNLEELSISEWRSVLLDDFGLPRLQIPWLEIYLSEEKGTVERIIHAACLHLQCVKRAKAKIILIADFDYPPLLRMIKDPPLCLTSYGDLNQLSKKRISIVGSRKACPRALNISFGLGQSLAESGYTVVSGGAFGCDIAAHNGVLHASSRSEGDSLVCQSSSGAAILVFAGGLSSLYPKGNMTIFKHLAQQGALFLSERLWDAPALPRDFPVRNRIVSGLSTETVVVQAGIKSGAMITARLAVDQGRDVSVLSFSDHEKAADGNLQLMEDGARVFYSAENWFDGAEL